MASCSKIPDEGPHDWEQYKETIRNLYIEKNLTLHRLIHEMKRGHAFNATKAQFERRLTRWGFKKNRKKREWIEIAEEVIRRRNEGKDSEVIINDQIIPSKKLKKEVRRYGRDLVNSVSIQGTGDQCFNTDEMCCFSLAADDAASSSIAIIRSPKPKRAVPQPRRSPSTSVFPANTSQTTRISASSAPSRSLLPSDVDMPLSRLLIDASSFLRAQDSTQKADLHGSMEQLLAASSPLNKSLKAAMVPSEYSNLMGADRSGQGQLSAATNLKIMSTAIFLFRNSLDEGSFDLGHQMFTWFQANYDARIFKFLAGSKDPLASAILEKLFRKAVCQGDSEMVRELLLTGIDPNQRWRVFCSVRRIHAEPKSAILIACEKKHLLIAKLLLNAGAHVPAVADPIRAPLCCLLEGNSPLDLDLVKQLIDATPEHTRLAYRGCLAAAVRRRDLMLIESLIEAGIGDYDLFQFSCLQRHCSQSSSEGNASLPCPTHTITFPVLKRLFIARAFRSLGFQRKDFIFDPWSEFRNCMEFFSDLLSSLLHQRNQQGVKFMMDAGVCFTKDLLLVLCGIPNLVIISQLLSEAILSFHVEQEERRMKIISNLANTVSLEPMPMPKNFKSSTETNGQSRDLAENVAMARKITEALTELPARTKSQCCEALTQNPLWRSLSPQDWPYYKEAFEVILLASNSDIDSSQALLLIAVKTRDAMELHRLLDADLSCSATALHGLLEEVISWGDVEIFQRLVNELMWIENTEGKDLDAYGSSFMENAILHGHLANVQELFRAGIAVNFALGDGLGLAISERQQEIVEFLLQSGADPNEEFFDSHLHSSPLSEALASEDADILRLLVRFGANPNDGEALCLASELNTTVLDKFISACRKDFLVKRGVPALFDAISNSELDTVQLLLRYGVDCNLLIRIEQLQRKTCLAAAIEARDCEILKLIIDTGVNINSVVEQDPKGFRTAFPRAHTALVKAIRCQNLSAIDMLLEAGAEVNPTETSGSPVGLTPVQAAAEQGNLDLVRKLLDLGANANDEPYPYGGYTALQITASKGLIGVASLLLERGADVNAKGAKKGGRTALEMAAENDRIDMVRFLVNSGAHIIGPDAHQYWQARTLALEHGHFAVSKLLEALYEEKSGGQSSAQVLSSPDVDFDFSFSSRIPTSYDLSDEPLDLTLIENFGESNDNQSGSASLVESWAWPLSS